MLSLDFDFSGNLSPTLMLEETHPTAVATLKEEIMFVATWNGAVIAQSDKTIEIEGNKYFPFDSVDQSVLVDSATTSNCPWKGTANYYSLSVDGSTNTDAVWVYREPKDAAKEIAGYVAFWRGVEVRAA
jgi:uncharacterized protein (DUF427 family)